MAPFGEFFNGFSHALGGGFTVGPHHWIPGQSVPSDDGVASQSEELDNRIRTSVFRDMGLNSCNKSFLRGHPNAS
ncbi:MAG: hypothetical protein ACRBN8_00965 [Nannocystales bacterium]